MLFISVSLLLWVVQGYSQTKRLNKIVVNKGMQVILRDTSFITKRDTLLYLNDKEIKQLKVRANPQTVSTEFYDSMRIRAADNSFTKDVFAFVVKKKKHKQKLVGNVVKSETVFKPFEGLLIATIVFKAVDLLEGSVTDTLQTASTTFGKFVNKMHRDTRSKIIANNLLFAVGDGVDPFQFADNERLLRQFAPLKDARIYISKSMDSENEVDVVIVTQDVASIGAAGSYSSPKHFRFDVYDLNMLGYARQLRLSYYRNVTSTTPHGYGILVRDPNFLHTFMQGDFEYINSDVRQQYRVSIGRDFFAPEIRYAGGIELYRTKEYFYYEEYDTLKSLYTENAIDVWAGRSLEFKKRMNLIFSARVRSRRFSQEPFVSSDSNSFFHNRTIILGSTSFAKRNYLTSVRIRGFGKTEDIPIGSSITFIGGKEINEFTDRLYFEGNSTFSHYSPSRGYFNFSIALGSFYKAGTNEDGLLTCNGVYFSDLVKIRRAEVRQFVFMSYMKGYNRILDQTLSIVGKWEDQQARKPLGNERFSIGVETVYFMPWYAYGFQFALYHGFSVNLLSMNTPLLSKTSTFPSFRIGVRTLNENLVLPVFSLEVAYFGKTKIYGAAWEIKFATSLKNLFQINQTFKPEITPFN